MTFTLARLGRVNRVERVSRISPPLTASLPCHQRTPAQHSMSADVQERPKKKVRFSSPDPPITDRALDLEPSLPDEINALPETVPDARVADCAETDHGDQRAEPSGNSGPERFDTELFASIVGQQVSQSVIQQLKDLSGNDIQRGQFLTPRRVCLSH